MPDGRRAFQFSNKRMAYTPVNATTTGAAYGNVFTSNTTVTGGYPVEVGCTFTFYSAWNEAIGAWIVTDYKVPDQLVC